MTIERAGYLPGLKTDDINWQAETYGPPGADTTVLLPLLSKMQAVHLSGQVREQAQRHLKSKPVGQIVDIIDRAIARLLDRNDPYRRRMDDLLPIISGYDRDMVRLGLTSYLKTFRRPQLQRFLAEDFANPAILDGFQALPKGGLGRAFGPDILAHIWAGNVPGLPLWSMVAGLLVKAGNIGKLPTAEPLFAGWFAQLLGEIEPDLADCLAVVWWRGGDTELESAVLNEADLVLGYGHDQSLAAIQSRIPITKRFLAFGHKVSFAMVSAAALKANKARMTARLAAHDVARYDQQGCYSPHVIFVESGGAVSPEKFAQYLAHELEVFEKKFPINPLSLAEVSAIAAWRSVEEMTPGGEVFRSASGAWTVSYQCADKTFQPSCLNRTIKVIAVETLADVPPIIAPFRALLQTVGIAAAPGELLSLSEALGRVGVTRIASLGDMTSPEAGWHHDGRFNLLDLIKITEIDGRAEHAADRLASYDE